jgi:ABC-type transport system involved in multi-copper enzyme maturation permease subunit
MNVIVIARLTFREALRRKVILGVVLLSIAFVVMYAVGFHLFRHQFLVSEARRAARPDAGPSTDYSVPASAMVLLGLFTVNFLTGIMTIFASVGTIAGEIEAGTLHAVVPKPIGRWQIILGKYLGFAVMLLLYIALMVGGVVLTAHTVGHYAPPRIVHGMLLVMLVSMILLSLTMLGSTIFSTVTNGVIVFMLYGMAVTGGLVEQVGTALNNDTLVNIGIGTSVLLPSDSMWRLASYVVQPRLAISMIGPNPLGTTVPPSNLAVHYAMAYCAVLVVGSMLVFQRRDL